MGAEPAMPPSTTWGYFSLNHALQVQGNPEVHGGLIPHTSQLPGICAARESQRT